MSETSGILGSEVQVVGLRGEGEQYKGKDYLETIQGTWSGEEGSTYDTRELYEDPRTALGVRLTTHGNNIRIRAQRSGFEV